jgi:hypothetical protein
MNVKTLFIFVLAAAFLIGCSSSKAQVENKNSKTENDISSEDKALKVESEEEKAVRIAEEFIKRNGYTDAPGDKDNLSYEAIEFSGNKDEMLEFRHNTLQPKAYGFLRNGKSNKKGWTIVFRYNGAAYKNMSDENYKSLGRAITMNEKFEDLRVEHQDIFLKAVKVKLEK